MTTPVRTLNISPQMSMSKGPSHPSLALGHLLQARWMPPLRPLGSGWSQSQHRPHHWVGIPGRQRLWFISICSVHVCGRNEWPGPRSFLLSATFPETMVF